MFIFLTFTVFTTVSKKYYKNKGQKSKMIFVLHFIYDSLSLPKLSFLNDLRRSRIILDCRLIAILTKQAG